jgi:ArsR family transcriptional regulator
VARKLVATVEVDSVCCAPLQAAPLDDADAVTLARAFSALADPVRLRLLSLLASAEAGEVCVCDLTEPVGKSQPTVSHHLKVLTEAGLVTSEKRGRWAWYRVAPDRLDALRAVLAPA